MNALPTTDSPLGDTSIAALLEQFRDQLVAELRAENQRPAWTDAAGVARHLDCDVEWVLDNKQMLGGVPMGDGPKPRYRFEIAAVDEAMRARRPQPKAPRKASSRRRTTKSQPAPRTIRPARAVLPIAA